MSKLKLMTLISFTFFSIQAFSNTAVTQDYSFITYVGEDVNDSCIDQTLKGVLTELGQSSMDYRIITDQIKLKTKNSFPTKLSVFSKYKYSRKLQLDISNCNSTFTFYYELVDENSCDSSEQVKKNIDNFYINSCLDLR